MPVYITTCESKYARKPILLLMAPHFYNTVVKTIPDYKWSKEFNGWAFPLSESSLSTIRSTLDQHDIEYQESVLVAEYLEKLKQKREEIKYIISNEDIEDEAIPVPYFNKLRNYQKQGVMFLKAVPNALLCDDPGLGKTLQGITLCESVDKSNGVLILCPTGARQGWLEEIERWTKSSAVVVRGSSTKAKLKKLEEEADYKIINFESARSYGDYLKSKKWSVMIIDEAHYLKNKKTILHGILKGVQADRKILMTANPMMNHVYDLWALLNILYPGTYSSYWNFVNKYCNIEENYFGSKPTTTKPDMVDDLRKELSTIMIRRNKAEVLTELPPKIYLSSSVEMSKEHRRIYDQIVNEKRINLMKTVNLVTDLNNTSMTFSENDKIVYYCTKEMKSKILAAYPDRMYNITGDNYMEVSQNIVAFRMSPYKYAVCSFDNPDAVSAAVEMRGGITVRNMLERTIRERQLLISPQMIDPALPNLCPKLDTLVDMVKADVEDGNKVIIYSQWTKTFGLLEPMLRKGKIKILEFSGRQTSAKNDLHKKTFMEDDEHYVLLLSTISGGVALNLQVASRGYRVDKHYNPFVNIQSEDRMHRMGQKDTVVIHDIIVENTIEDKIESILKQRKDDYDAVMDRKDILDLLGS